MYLRFRFIPAIIFCIMLWGCSSKTPGIPEFSFSGYNESNNKYHDLIRKYNPKISKANISNILSGVNHHSRINKIDPRLVLSVMAKESAFREKAVSSAGAVGLGQLMTPTAKEMGIKDPFNPEENIKGTTKYLGWLLRKYRGNLDKTLSAYNWGPNAVDKALKTGKNFPSGVKSYAKGVIKLYSSLKSS